MPAANSVQVLYIRHGESEANLARQFSFKSCDPPLTEQGRAQADALTTALRHLGQPFHHEIVCSPQLPAEQTATVLATGLGLAVVRDERLRDIDVGILDGRSDQRAWDAYTEIQRRWSAGEASRRFPEGENFRSLLQRLRAALLDAAAAPGRTPGYGYGDPPPVVLVVGHAAGFRCVLSQLINNVADAYPHEDMPFASVSALSARPVLRPSGIRLEHWGLVSGELSQLEPQDPFGL
ncbi:histidine phosphatase family protein [Flindersiella endophytica]